MSAVFTQMGATQAVILDLPSPHHTTYPSGHHRPRQPRPYCLRNRILSRGSASCDRKALATSFKLHKSVGGQLSTDEGSVASACTQALKLPRVSLRNLTPPCSPTQVMLAHKHSEDP